MNLYKDDTLIVSDIHIADSFIKRLRGYMFHREPQYNCIVLSPCNSIHTFFMKFDIDVLFLDDNMTVIKKISALKKNRTIPPIKEVIYTVEAPSGCFELVKIGDFIKMC